MTTEFTELTSFTDSMDANLCKVKLELNGIEAKIEGDIISSIQWSLSNTLEGKKVEQYNMEFGILIVMFIISYEAGLFGASYKG